MKFKYTHMLTLAFLTTLSLSANEQQDKQIYLSAVEVQEIYNNPTRSYVYVGRDVSNLADIIAEISKLETDENSPLKALEAHINKGFVIGNYDGVAQALEHAEAVLNEADPKGETELSQALNTIIEQVDAEQLNLDAEMLEAANVQAPETRACGTCNSHCLRKLVVKEKVDFLNDVKFRDDVTFYDDVRFRDDVRIDGTLSVTDLVVLSCIDSLCINNLSVGNEVISNLTVTTLSTTDAIITNATITALSATDIFTQSLSTCDVIVGCDILMNNSTSSAVGNIFKGGNRFLHNFGANNTFVGINAGNFTMTGTSNTAVGINTLLGTTTGSNNVAVGVSALQTNTIGDNNTAVGTSALTANTTGLNNTAVGANALDANTIGTSNTSIGVNALGSNTTGTNNNAFGSSALGAVTTGNNNIGIGLNAGVALVTGSNNIYIGANAAAAGESNVTRIAGIRGATTGVADAIAVLIDSTGQLGTINSSKAVKHNIQSMNDVSANIYNLNPVTFVYNGDASETTQYGLIAEEVADVFPGIVVRNANGQPETVQYHVLPILTLNELQKLAARVAVLEAHLMN